MIDFETWEKTTLFTERPNPIEGDIQFYHTMDLPGPRGTVFGPWDLRAGLDVYLGRVDYSGRTVLEMYASGEHRGVARRVIDGDDGYF